MLIKLSLLILALSLIPKASGCEFKKHVSKVFSLSGPMTVALKHLGLLNKSQVQGISVFNPMSKDDFKGKRYPGGVFISQGTFAEFGGGIVFFDESRELSRILGPMNSIQGIELKTRGLVPGEVTSYLIKQLELIVENCNKEFAGFLNTTKKEEDKLLSLFPKSKFVVYFLGEYRQGNPPDMIMVNDGIVKWLIEKGKIKTYPSPLAYVNWSAKVMKNLPNDVEKIAVKDSAENMVKSKRMDDDHLNFVYPGSLVPGISQLEAWNYLMSP